MSISRLFDLDRVGVFCGERRMEVRVRMDLRLAGGCDGVAVMIEDGAGELGGSDSRSME